MAVPISRSSSFTRYEAARPRPLPAFLTTTRTTVQKTPPPSVLTKSPQSPHTSRNERNSSSSSNSSIRTSMAMTEETKQTEKKDNKNNDPTDKSQQQQPAEAATVESSSSSSGLDLHSATGGAKLYKQLNASASNSVVSTSSSHRQLTAKEEEKSWLHLDSVHSRASVFEFAVGDSALGGADGEDDDDESESSFASFGASDSSMPPLNEDDHTTTSSTTADASSTTEKSAAADDPLAAEKAAFQRLAEDMPKTMTPSRRLLLNRAHSVRVRPRTNFKGPNLSSLMEERPCEW